MPRVKLSEYKAKQLILGDTYKGTQMHNRPPSLSKKERFVVKVDQGVKKRFKQGLVALDQSTSSIKTLTNTWRKRGFTQFLIEPYFEHDQKEERYLSLERVREGMRLLFAESGGVDIEAHPEAIKTCLISRASDLKLAAQATGLPIYFLQQLIDVFEKNFFAFVEINPLVVRGSDVHLLDAAVLVDSAGEYFVNHGWTSEDVIESKAKHPAEDQVHDLAKTTPASLKLTVLNPNGSLFFLLSGGGGSIVIADQAALKGKGTLIGNYGEYSGGPTREETHLYAREVIHLLLDSKAKKKALVIAGGVANFTDVLTTFRGIIDAVSEQAEKLRRAKVKIFVRRGGPNEAVGLAHMKAFLEQEKLLGSIHGSETMITQAVDEAIDYVC